MRAPSAIAAERAAVRVQPPAASILLILKAAAAASPRRHVSPQSRATKTSNCNVRPAVQIAVATSILQQEGRRALPIHSRHRRIRLDRERRGAGPGYQDRPDLRQDRPAGGLRQADRNRAAHGPGIRHQGHHDGRRPQDRDHHQGRPEQAGSVQGGAGGSLSGRQGRYRDRHDVVGRGAGRPSRRRGKQEDPDRRARGRGSDYRREVEPLHLPHRPQFLAGCDLERGRDRQARRHHRDAGAGLCLRPRRRCRLQGGAGQDRRDAGGRGIRRRPTRRISPRPASACSTR